MHYIRFLKPPCVSKGILSGKLTVANDLGEAFLSRDLTIQIKLIEEETGKVYSASRSPTLIKWKKGARELPWSVVLPAARNGGKAASSAYKLKWRVSFSPISGTETIGAEKLEDILSFDGGKVERKPVRANGCVLCAISPPFSPDIAEQNLPAVVYRQFNISSTSTTLSIEEETGNSIARHIWDAGVTLSALIEVLCASQPEPACLPALRKLLKWDNPPLTVLELGTGCGIVSATLSHLRPLDTILATDMPEATEIATTNLAQKYGRMLSSDGTPLAVEPEYVVLDWTEEVPPQVATKTFDLVMVADCTYNSDVVPDLVNTLKRVTDHSQQALIVVALKRRHDSESIFFDLMSESGLRSVEMHTERSGMFDGNNTGNEEEIEIHVFAASDWCGWKGETSAVKLSKTQRRIQGLHAQWKELHDGANV